MLNSSTETICDSLVVKKFVFETDGGMKFCLLLRISHHPAFMGNYSTISHTC